MSKRALYVEGVCFGGLRIRYLLIMWFCWLPQAVTVKSHQSCSAVKQLVWKLATPSLRLWFTARKGAPTLLGRTTLATAQPSNSYATEDLKKEGIPGLFQPVVLTTWLWIRDRRWMEHLTFLTAISPSELRGGRTCGPRLGTPQLMVHTHVHYDWWPDWLTYWKVHKKGKKKPSKICCNRRELLWVKTQPPN